MKIIKRKIAYIFAYLFIWLLFNKRFTITLKSEMLYETDFMPVQFTDLDSKTYSYDINLVLSMIKQAVNHERLVTYTYQVNMINRNLMINFLYHE